MDSDSKNEQDDVVIVDEELVDRYPGLEDYLGHRVRMFFSYDGELSGLHVYD
jgi:hypothetical protein